jgi:Helix-turn-helix domain/PASTA domain
LTARPEDFSRRSGAWQGATGRFPVARSVASYSGRPIGIGEALREAREALGVSFETAERDTHIPRHHLQALEEERFDAFHAPVYVRGFLRSYSQYLHLDSTELLALLPPDRPLEDERLMPLSRLGRPRGPREAARERRDPSARDAPPVTSAVAAFEENRARRDPGPSNGLLVMPRLDPLGRLGWPEQPGESNERDEISEDAAHAKMAGYTRPATVTNPAWEHPLNPRRARHWEPTSQWRTMVPDDTRPLFGQRPLLAMLATALGFFVLLLVVLSVAGGDTSPTLIASANGGGGGTLAIPAGLNQAGAHGAMPNLHGTEVSQAIATLHNQGVTPIVLTQGAAANQTVSGQIPSPGTQLNPQSAVLIVTGGGS